MALYGDGSNVNKTTDATASTTFGSANAYPLITVDGNQRISAINNQAISLNAAINANASVGDIGTYAFMQQSSTSNTEYAPGATLAGSSLRYSDATGRTHSTTPLGNWRCMGYDSGAAYAVASNTGSASASASGNVSGSLQGGQVQGNASLQGGEVQGNASLQGGEVQGNTNTNGNMGVNGVQAYNTKGSLGVGTNGLNVGGNVGTSGLNVGGNVGTSGLDVSGNITGTASINVSVNSVSTNTTVAFSATLWLRYS
jgi:hypothetical protein